MYFPKVHYEWPFHNNTLCIPLRVTQVNFIDVGISHTAACVPLSSVLGPQTMTTLTLAPPAKRLRTTKCRILDLPDDVLHRIFSHFNPTPTLCHLMEVCARFAEIAASPKLWNHVRAIDPGSRKRRMDEARSKYQFINYDEIKEAAFKTVNSRKRKQRKQTRPRKCNKVGVSLAIDVITRRARKHLRTLDLEDCYPGHPCYDYQMTDKDLDTIINRCAGSLHEFRISRSCLLTAQALVDMASKHPSLRTLHLVGCRTLSESHIGTIVKDCPLLEDLSVSQCPSFRADVLHRTLFPRRAILRRLDISATDTRKLALAQFLEHFIALEELKADGCVHLSLQDQVCQYPQHHVSRLNTLNMDRIYTFSPGWFAFIFKYCQNLRSFSAGMLEYRGQGQIIRNTLPPLYYLNIAGHPITDDQWQTIFEHLGSSLVQCDVSKNRILTCKLRVFRDHTFASLEDLNIGSTGATDCEVMALMAVAPKLKFLDLSGCSRVNRKIRRNPLAFRENSPLRFESIEY